MFSRDGGRIVLEHDADVLIAVDVLVHRRHPGNPVGEEQVLGVGST